MMMTTLASVPWVGPWLATLAFGASFPGHAILGRLYIEHVFVGPSLIVAFVAAHLFLVLRLTHTDYPGRGRSDRFEVGAPMWPVQTARSTTLLFLVFGTIALLSAFFPVEAVEVYGPFQSLSSYPPLAPDWFLLWVEGAFRLLPRQLDFRAFGATFTNPFYGAVVLPLAVFASCAAYPLFDRRLYRDESRQDHILEHWTTRPFRAAFGASGLSFLVFLSLAVLNGDMARVASTAVWQVNVVWGIATCVVPAIVFAVLLSVLRTRNGGRRRTTVVPHGPAPTSEEEAH